jgi:hypothetical protein
LGKMTDGSVTIGARALFCVPFVVLVKVPVQLPLWVRAGAMTTYPRVETARANAIIERTRTGVFDLTVGVTFIELSTSFL